MLLGKAQERSTKPTASAMASQRAPALDPDDGLSDKPGNSAHSNFPVTDIEKLDNLSNEELYDIFHQGVADIPSALPDQLGAPLLHLLVAQLV